MIAIVTTFGDIDRSYSLCTVVLNQIKTLKELGQDVCLLVQESFPDIDVGCEIRRCMPNFTFKDHADSVLLDEDKENIKRIARALEENLSDVDIAIEHDFFLQGWFYLHGLASIQANTKCKWFHQIHSCPSKPLIKVPADHDLIYLNYTDRIMVAERYNVMPSRVHVVYNEIDSSYVENNEFSFGGAEVRIVYPFSTTRTQAKGVQKLLKLAEKIKKYKSVSVILCNAHANADAEIHIAKGLQKDYIQVTSLMGYPNGVPNEIVRTLFKNANVFVFPTSSENNSLVLLEAMAGENICILNDDFLPLREFGGAEQIYMKFGSTRQNTKYSNIEKYYDDYARIIIDRLDSDTGRMAKRRYYQLKKQAKSQLRSLVSSRHTEELGNSKKLSAVS